MKQLSYSCSCIDCKKQFSSLGIDTHYLRSHGNSEEKNVFARASIVNKNKAEKIKEEYYKSPKKCNNCNLILEYSKRNNRFCSQSCRAKTTNYERKINGYSMPETSRQKIKEKLSLFSGPYSKVYFRCCKFCENLFTTTTRKQVCSNCQHLKWKNNKDQYSFKFNIFDYPDLFNLSTLEEIGWVSFGGKRGGKKNPYGLSRDHKVSVNEAKKFNYDPYYISHPLNCQLIPHIENNKKKTKSSMSYKELIKLVDEYDNGVLDQTRTG
jgi:hypothetical protein